MKEKCTVKDGMFVEPCDTLSNVTEILGSERRKGMCVWNYTNMHTREASRTMYGVKTASHPNGLVFNFCPFCGERIDGPAMQDSKDAAHGIKEKNT